MLLLLKKKEKKREGEKKKEIEHSNQTTLTFHSCKIETIKE
jgi:hypothetical protein